MLSFNLSLITAVCIALGGLSTSLREPGQNPPLSFKPKFDLKWPGKPTESSSVRHSKDGEDKDYSASFEDTGPERFIMYHAFVNEFPGLMTSKMTPKQTIEAFVMGSKKDETSRKIIQHGQKKHPGLKITTHRGRFFERKVVIMAGPRIYPISVTTTNEDLLKSTEVRAFFDSLSLVE